MEKIYNPKAIESKWSQYWEQYNCFSLRSTNTQQHNKNDDNFCIMLPPPNVTGNLHMGHAFQHTIMDCLIRFNKMRGAQTLWQPGLDHAGISTQMVIERQLAGQGIKRTDLSKEEFVKKIYEWKEEYSNVITKQMKRLGTAIDWSLSKFTLDPDFCYAVKKVFISLYKEGLIFKGKKLINWDPVLQTAISDLEVINEEVKGHLWYIKYNLVEANSITGSNDNYLVIATTRPETLLGDVAVAVNPTDHRYKHLIGKEVLLPIINKKIPIIGDDYVDPRFGSGCVKITPAHDHNDYAIALRHNLPLVNIFTKAITLNDNTPSCYQGLDQGSARKKILKDLEDQFLVVKVEDCLINIPRSSNTNAIVEPFLTDQWFVKMSELAAPAIDVVTSGKLKFIPTSWGNNYLEWLNKIQDWCISRQLWWGHQIPAWYDEHNNIYVDETEEAVRKNYNLADEVKLIQETDVLDTWFSAALWPFVTLGWPQQTDLLTNFFPTNVLVTGFDIIFFWVARMVMFSLKFTQKVPFDAVYIHGIIQDQEGNKMSKTKGNVIDPIDLIDGISLPKLIIKRTTGLMQPQLKSSIEQKTKQQFPQGITSFGTDALRFTYCAIATQSRHIKFEFVKLEGYRNFCNKLWNAARFVLINSDPLANEFSIELLNKILLEKVTKANDEINYCPEQWILSIWQDVKRSIINQIKNYRIDLASKSIYEFVWNEYCDWYLEFAKHNINNASIALGLTKKVLIFVLQELLKVLHPFIPYITEEIWHTLHSFNSNNDKDQCSILIEQKYPEYDFNFVNIDAEQAIDWTKKFITVIRNLRSSFNVAPNIKIPMVFIHIDLPKLEKKYLLANQELIKKLAKIENISITNDLTTKQNAITSIINTTEIWLSMVGLFDLTTEIDRINKEIAKLSNKLEIVNNKLKNPEYLKKAPSDLVVKEQNKQLELQEAINKLKNNLLKFSLDLSSKDL